MTYIKRLLGDEISRKTPPKAVVIFGARQIGKTTMLNRIFAPKSRVRWYNGDNPEDVEELSLRSAGDVKTVLSQGDAIVIDEAQKVPSIGLTLKRLVDMNKTLEHPVQIFATGSSSFDLAAGVKESAVGRLVNYQMWPLSVGELAAERGWGSVRQNIDWNLVYGMYPEINTVKTAEAQALLRNHVDGVLYKDIFTLSGIRLNDRFQSLVKLLAYNVGSEVSYDGLSRETGLNKTTVADYVTLLEQCCIVKVCPSYAKNLANELKKGKKIYFCDNGIRNAIIGDFSPFSARSDAGALWENFFFMERVKHNSINSPFKRIYFWRTSGRKQNELDFIEIENNEMHAFECKLSEKARAKPGDEFLAAYPQCKIETVTPRSLIEVFGNI